MRVSIHTLPSIENLNEVAQLIQKHPKLDRQVEDNNWPAEDVLRIGFSRIENVPMTVQTHQPPGRRAFEYVFVQARAEQPKRKRFWFHEDGSLRLRDDRLHIADVPVLFFVRDGHVHVAVFTQSENSIEMLKEELFQPQWWGDLLGSTTYHADPDFFYWIVRSRMESDGVLGEDVTVQEVAGFNGHTAKDVHQMIGKGDRIYEILSTMGFIFSNDPFDALTMDIQEQDEWTAFSYDRMGNATLSELQYRGRFVGDVVGEHRRGLIVAYLYTHLIPRLFELYSAADKNWTPEVRFSFVRRVGANMVRRIAKQLDWDDSQPLRDLLQKPS